MKRSRVCCLVISVIIVVLIQIANSRVGDYSPMLVVLTSLVYFAGAVLITTAIEGIIQKKNVRLCIIMVGVGIFLIMAIMTAILSLYCTLGQNYRNIAFGIFIVSFVGFWVFDMLLFREEQKRKAK